jgi:hypothetical protein
MIKKRGGGGGHDNRINKVVLHDFYHIHAAQDWSNKTDFIFEFQIGIEFFGLKPKLSIISLIWQELLFICSNRVRLNFVKAIKPN